MLTYLIRRLLYVFPILLGVMVVTFALVSCLELAALAILT